MSGDEVVGSTMIGASSGVETSSKKFTLSEIEGELASALSPGGDSPLPIVSSATCILGAEIEPTTDSVPLTTSASLLRFAECMMNGWGWEDMR